MRMRLMRQREAGHRRIVKLPSGRVPVHNTYLAVAFAVRRRQLIRAIGHSRLRLFFPASQPRLTRGSFFSLQALRRLRRALLGRDRDRRLALSIGGIKRDSNESYDAYLRFDVTRRKNKHPLLERSTLRFDRLCFIHVPAIRYSSFINPTHINLPAEAT